MTNINVPLDELELAALIRVAESDRRHPREQAALIIRRELERAGLLPANREIETAQSFDESIISVHPVLRAVVEVDHAPAN